VYKKYQLLLRFVISCQAIPTKNRLTNESNTQDEDRMKERDQHSKEMMIEQREHDAHGCHPTYKLRREEGNVLLLKSSRRMFVISFHSLVRVNSSRTQVQGKERCMSLCHEQRDSLSRKVTAVFSASISFFVCFMFS